MDTLNATEQDTPEHPLRRHFMALVFSAQPLIHEGEYQES
jgi:hypothetical protein